MVGAAKVARLIVAFAGMLDETVRVESREVNRQPGVLVADLDGNLVAVMALDVLDGRIQEIRTVINPDKLDHLGPVADAWRLRDEVMARRAANRPAAPGPGPRG